MIDPDRLDFNKAGGLLPCIVQDAHTLCVLMLGYMNKEALQKTLKEKRVVFFSRSKGRLWTKGEVSGNYLNLVEIAVDCDQDTLLVKAHPEGPVCHTGSATCFSQSNKSNNLSFLEETIANRKENPLAGSYTSSLLGAPIGKVAQKVGEESVELIIEAMGNNKALFINEAADLMYHYLVLLAAKGSSLAEVIEVLEKRHQR